MLHILLPIFGPLVGTLIACWAVRAGRQKDRREAARRDACVDLAYDTELPAWLAKTVDDLWPSLEGLAYEKLRHRYLGRTLVEWLFQSNERHYLAQKAVGMAYAAVWQLHRKPCSKKVLQAALRREVCIAVLEIMTAQDERAKGRLLRFLLMLIAFLTGPWKR